MKKDKAFTLIELLVVIAIVGLLSSIVLIGVNSARGKARIAKGLQFNKNIEHSLGDSMIARWCFDEGYGTVAAVSSGKVNSVNLS